MKNFSAEFEGTNAADFADRLPNQTEEVRRLPTSPKIGSTAFSLTCLFQIVTGCCIFFAIVKTSPLLAILATLIATPAIIRTSLAADLYRKRGSHFTWHHRVKFFLESTGLAVVTYAISIFAFLLISIMIGLLCLGATFVLGVEEMSTDIAYIGSIGGMVWGAAGAILAFGFCVRRWRLEA